MGAAVRDLVKTQLVRWRSSRAPDELAPEATST
jgi:hypothetical protein